MSRGHWLRTRAFWRDKKSDLHRNILFSGVSTHKGKGPSDIVVKGSQFEHSAPEMAKSPFTTLKGRTLTRVRGEGERKQVISLPDPEVGVMRVNIGGHSLRNAKPAFLPADEPAMQAHKDRLAQRWWPKRQNAINRAIRMFRQRDRSKEVSLFLQGERLAGRMLDALGLQARNLGSEIVFHIPNQGQEKGIRDMVMYGRDEQKHRVAVSVEVMPTFRGRDIHKIFYGARSEVKVVDLRNVTPDEVAAKGPKAVEEHVRSKVLALTQRNDSHGIEKLRGRVIKDAKLAYNVIMTTEIDQDVARFLGLQGSSGKNIGIQGEVRIEDLKTKVGELTPRELTAASKSGNPREALAKKINLFRNSLPRTVIALTDAQGKKVVKLIGFHQSRKGVVTPFVVDKDTWTNMHTFPEPGKVAGKENPELEYLKIFTRLPWKKRVAIAEEYANLNPYKYEADKARADMEKERVVPGKRHLAHLLPESEMHGLTPQQREMRRKPLKVNVPAMLARLEKRGIEQIKEGEEKRRKKFEKDLRRLRNLSKRELAGKRLSRPQQRELRRLRLRLQPNGEGSSTR